MKTVVYPKKYGEIPPQKTGGTTLVPCFSAQGKTSEPVKISTPVAAVELLRGKLSW